SRPSISPWRWRSTKRIARRSGSRTWPLWSILRTKRTRRGKLSSEWSSPSASIRRPCAASKRKQPAKLLIVFDQIEDRVTLGGLAAVNDFGRQPACPLWQFDPDHRDLSFRRDAVRGQDGLRLGRPAP